MNLKLSFPPEPEFAPRHAELAVNAARKVDGITLDYSVKSLQALDDIIERLRGEGVSTEQIGETLFAFGCYVGEVFVRSVGGKWRLASETGMRDFAGFIIVVDLGADNVVNPIGKVFKRFENGIEDHLPYFYQVFAKPPPHLRPPSTWSSLSGWLRRLIKS